MTYKLTSIQIDKFRNIKNMNLKFGSRLNIISGQNGAGKSNILSMIASATGTSKTKSYPREIAKTDAAFQPDFLDYFVINTDNKTIEPFLDYRVFSTYINCGNEKDSITKFLRFKNDSRQIRHKGNPETKRPIKIVPTTTMYKDNSGNFATKKEAQAYSKLREVQYEGRILLPTQYLSISRLVPRGETTVNSSTFATSSNYVKNQDNIKYKEWYNEVLPFSILEDNPLPEKISKGTLGTSVDEPIEFSTKNSISVGQDSLGKIISALVNFNIISQSESYSGGVLCIDEFDISLHPDAQKRLIHLLDRLSSDLNIQIFLTTHSLTALKELSLLIKGNSDSYSIIYLQDRRMPHVLLNPSYNAIVADMNLVATSDNPNIKLYCEDNCTFKILKICIDAAQSLKLLKKYDPAYVKHIDATFGKTNLVKLSKNDSNFSNSILILDGDAQYNDSQNFSKYEYILSKDPLPAPGNKVYTANIVTLPTPFSPEAFIYYLVNKYVKEFRNPIISSFWAQENLGDLPFGRQFLEEKILLSPDQTNKSDFNTEFLKHNKSMALDETTLSSLTGFTATDRPDRLDIMFNFIKESHMLVHYYENDDIFKLALNKFSSDLDTAYLKTQQKLISKRL